MPGRPPLAAQLFDGVSPESLPAPTSAQVQQTPKLLQPHRNTHWCNAGRGGRGGSQAKAAPRGPSSMAKAANSLVQRGSGANATIGHGTERTQWLLLIDALKKKCAACLEKKTHRYYFVVFTVCQRIQRHVACFTRAASCSVCSSIENFVDWQKHLQASAARTVSTLVPGAASSDN